METKKLQKKRVLVFSETFNLGGERYEFRFFAEGEYSLENPPSNGGPIVTDFPSLYDFANVIKSVYNAIAESTDINSFREALPPIVSKHIEIFKKK